MSHDHLLNALKGRAAQMDDQRGVARHAMVTSCNPNNATVRVVYDEEGTTSGWLPVTQFAAGPGWSGVCLPPPGTQVFVVPDMGFMDHGVVVGATHSTVQPVGKVTPYKATEAVPLVPGEITFMHESGASFRLTAGGVIEIHGTLKVDGSIVASGEITAMDGGSAVHLSTHKHVGVQPGSGVTGAPQPGT